jgi:hypothetical protein
MNHHLERFQNKVEMVRQGDKDIRGGARDILGRWWDGEERIGIGGLKVHLGVDGKTCANGR